MRLMKQNIDRDGSGTVTLLPEDPEDMWTTYNLLRPSDLLRASAIRRITTESATGSTSSHRIHLQLTLRVRSTHFDAQAATLAVSGQIAAETAHAKLGQFHTLDLELGRAFTIEKGDDGGDGGGWDSVARELVRAACDVTRGAAAWAVVMQEGLANIAVLTGERTVLRQRVEASIPKKRTAGPSSGGSGGHDKGLQRFYQTLLETLLRHVDLAEKLPILLAGPGFVADGFKRFAMEWAARTADKALLGQRENLLVVHASSGHLHSLDEVLKDPAVLHRLKDTKFTRETRCVDQFMAMLRRDDQRAWYGPREVERAVQRGAVGRGGGVLLVSNLLFRSHDVGVRKRWVALVDRVREVEGGEVRILSSEHESGKRLEGLGGIAAILTFPIEDLDAGDGDGDEPAEEGGENTNGVTNNEQDGEIEI